MLTTDDIARRPDVRLSRAQPRVHGHEAVGIERHARRLQREVVGVGRAAGGHEEALGWSMDRWEAWLVELVGLFLDPRITAGSGSSSTDARE